MGEEGEEGGTLAYADLLRTYLGLKWALVSGLYMWIVVRGGTYSNGAINTNSMRLNGAGYVNSSGARIIPIVLSAK